MLPLRILAAAVPLLSCGPTTTHPFDLVDSLGVAFEINEDGEWNYPDDPLPPCQRGNPGWGGIYGRFVYLCSACYDDAGNYGFDTAADCRVAVCEHDDDCPELDGRAYECVANICQEPAQITADHISLTSAEALCAATTPRGDPNDPELETRLAALACVDDECPLPLPAGCMQPAP